MKLSDKELSDTHRVLVFGPPKSGKSQLVGALSEHFNLLWFDCEQGWSVLKKLDRTWQERIEIISIPDSRVYPIAAETWLKVVKGDAGSVCEQHGKWICPLCKKNPDMTPIIPVNLNALGSDTIVVFDSLTQFSNSLISHVTKTQPDDYKLEFDDWNKLGVLLDKFLSQIQAARFNVICITHESEIEMNDGKNKLVPTAGTRNFSRNTAKYFDDVIYSEVKNGKHRYTSSTTASSTILTGSRTGVVLEKDESPTLLRIFKPELFTNESKETISKVTVSTTPSQNTQGATAVLSLKEKLAAMKAQKDSHTSQGIDNGNKT